jgi:hypothetical protein
MTFVMLHTFRRKLKGKGVFPSGPAAHKEVERSAGPNQSESCSIPRLAIQETVTVS